MALTICVLLVSLNIQGANNQQIENIENEAISLSKIWNAKEMRQSIGAFGNASEKWLKTGNPKRASFCLRESAKLLIRLSELSRAERILKKALAIDEKRNDLDGQVLSLSLLSSIYITRGKQPLASKTQRNAIALTEKTMPKTRAFSYLIAGKNEFWGLNMGSSKKHLEKALSILANNPDDSLKVHILLNLGLVHGVKNEKNLALKKIESAESILGGLGDKRGIAFAHNARGFIYAISGEPQKGLDHYSKAIELFPEGVDSFERGKAFNGIAAIHGDYGKFDLAKINGMKALSDYTRAQNEMGQLAALIDLGQWTFQLGLKNDSREYLSRALELSQELDHTFFWAIAQDRIGRVDLKENKTDSAIKRFSNCRIKFEEMGVKQPSVLNNLGRAYEKKGDVDEARKYFERAVKENREIQDTAELAESLFLLSKLNAKDGKLRTALRESSEAVSLTESLYSDVANNSLRSAYISNEYDRYENQIGILMELHKRFPSDGYAQKAFIVSEKVRARFMQETLRLGNLEFLADADPKTIENKKEIENLLDRKKNELTTLLSSNSNNAAVSGVRAEIEGLKNQLDEMWSKLKRESPVFFALKSLPAFDIESFQESVLDEKSLLLEFSLGSKESYLWVIGKRDFEVIVLPKRAIIETQAANLLELLSSQNEAKKESIAERQKRIKFAEDKFLRDSVSLSNDIFGKIINKIKGKRLIIVPDGKLSAFPFSALPFPNRGDQNQLGYEPLLVFNEIVYEPSASVLQLIQNLRKRTVPTKQFFVVADPVFNSSDSRLPKSARVEENKSGDEATYVNQTRSFSTLNSLGRLFGTLSEAESIVQRFGENNSKVVVGFRANRDTILNSDIANYQVLHFATHGIVNEDEPDLSGIVVSRFDKAGNKRNGLIRLQDIYGLRLSADLVVLSACDSALGEEVRGEGLISLSNGFLQAGAKSVVSSLWKVDDNATSILMKNFYELLSTEGITPAEALRKAQIRMLKDSNFRSPMYWASFSINGDFRHKLKVSKSFDYSNYGVGILLGIAVWLVLRGRFLKRKG